MNISEIDKLDFYSKEDHKINKENGKNLTEKRFSDIMVDVMDRRFFEEAIFTTLENGNVDVTTLGKKYAVEFVCIGDRTRGIRSDYLTPSYVLQVYKRYRNEKGHGALEIWKTYWFNIRHVDFRLSENYNENIKKDEEWFARLKSKEIFKYNTVNEFKDVLEKVKIDLFN